MCEFRLGRQGAATRVQVPFEGDKTASDILACLRKIRGKAERWNKRGGQQGYLQFVNEFVHYRTPAHLWCWFYIQRTSR